MNSRFVFLSIFLAGLLHGQNILAVFSLNEPTNNTWPEQPIEFRYDGGQPNPRTTRMMGPSGSEVPYQWSANCHDPAATQGCILVRSGLSANQAATWTLQSGVAPTATQTHAVTLSTGTCPFGSGTCWIMKNGLTGVAIPRSQASPYNWAPMQGWLLPDQTTWTGIGVSPNKLYTIDGSFGTSVFAPVNTEFGSGGWWDNINNYTTTVLDQGPLKTAIQVNYDVYRPIYTRGAITLTACGTGTPGTVTFAGPLGVGRLVQFWTGTLCAGLAVNAYYVPTLVGGSTYALSNPDGTPVTISGTSFSGAGANEVIESDPSCVGSALGCNNHWGHMTFTITMYANSKAIFREMDSDLIFAEYYPIKGQVNPNIVRWRGRGDACGYDPVCGYLPPISVTNAAATSPIQVTLASPLLSTDGYKTTPQVAISGVGGITQANGTFYVKTSGGSCTTSVICLYTDAGLTLPVSGTGTYTSGGMVKPGYMTFGDPKYEAYVDITYDMDRPLPIVRTTTTGMKLSLEYTAAYTGFPSWMYFFNSGAGPSGPVVGLFTGDVSHNAWTRLNQNMPGLYTSNYDWITHSQAAYIAYQNSVSSASNEFIGPENNYSVHNSWGIYVDTQANLPTVDNRTAQPSFEEPIAVEQNALGGINLTDLYRYVLAFPDPPGPGCSYSVNNWKPAWLDCNSQATIRAWTKDAIANGAPCNSSPDCFYNLLASLGGPEQSIAQMWHGDNAAATTNAFNTMMTDFLSGLQSFGQILAVGDNRHGLRNEGYQIMEYSAGMYRLWTALLSDPHITPAQQTTVKAFAGLVGGILEDNKWCPYSCTGANGTASGGLGNQIAQYTAAQALIPALFPTNPSLSRYATDASIFSTYNFYVNNGGYASQAGSTWYNNAFVEPMKLTLMLLASNGKTSWSRYPLLKDYCSKVVLSNLTPIEYRFGADMRKFYGNGDGNTATNILPKMCRTMANKMGDNTLAATMAWADSAMDGSSAIPVSGFIWPGLIYSTTPVPVVPNLTSIHIPGYHSSLRHGFNTTHETALWFINGSFYSNQAHRHNDDGQVTIYAHSAPLALDWTPNLYYPDAPCRFMHNVVSYDSDLTSIGHSWSDDNIPVAPGQVGVPGCYQMGTSMRAFQAFSASSNSTASFSGAETWTRTARIMAPDPAYPIIYVKDAFSGNSGKTLTWQLMASGPVSTPAGSMTPTIRDNDPAGCSNSQLPNALPSNGTVHSLSNGLQQLSFTGQYWAQHPNHGIDWNLYQRPISGSAQFLIGHWSVACSSGLEATEYQSANGASYRHSQYILRVHDTGPFETVITPITKGTAPPSITYQNGAYSASFGSGEVINWNDSFMSYTDGTRQILTTYDTSTQTAFGITLRGGASEVVLDGLGTVTWTITDISPATRCLTLPGTWYPSAPVVQQRDGSWCYYPQAPNQQPSPVKITFGQTATGLRTVTVSLHPPRTMNAAAARIKFGSTANYAALATCDSGVCSVTFQAPVGTHSFAWEYLDNSGNVLQSSTEQRYGVE